MPRLQLVGQKFNRLEVISEAGVDPKSRAVLWLVRCECGTERTVKGSALVNGKTRSCGCLQREHARTFRRTHGHCVGYTQTPEHHAWQAMIQRCHNPDDKRHKDYGARGITVCDRWRESFENFIADMGPKPAGNLTIERRNNDLGYSPGNCYWATWHEQGKNKRNSRKVTFRGRTEIVSEWARVTGIPNRTILNRLNNGEPPERILHPWSESQPLPEPLVEIENGQYDLHE